MGILHSDGMVSDSSHVLLLFLFKDRKEVFQGSFEMKILGVVFQRCVFFPSKNTGRFACIRILNGLMASSSRDTTCLRPETQFIPSASSEMVLGSGSPVAPCNPTQLHTHAHRARGAHGVRSQRRPEPILHTQESSKAEDTHYDLCS